jgi:hypothetical protein
MPCRSLLKFLIPPHPARRVTVAGRSRLALVIGQSAYKSVPALPNPANDAKAMTQLLSVPFTVLSASDLSQNELRAKVSEFAGEVAANGADTVALVFYAGHGLQIDGENFLVPVDVDVKREADIPIQAVRLNDILNTLNSVPSKMRILLLDACRNNPFPELNKSAGHGLAIVDARIGAPGTFLSFSTLARRSKPRMRRRQQPVHDRAERGERAGADRGHVQACPSSRQQGDRRPADAVGQLVTDRGFPLRVRAGRGECRSIRAETGIDQAHRGRMEARLEWQTGRDRQRTDRRRRHRRGL